MTAANWPSTASLLLAHVNDLSGSCPVGASCDGATGLLHPTLAEFRRAVAVDFKVVRSPGLGEHRSLDGVIVLIAESDHHQPDAATRALQSIWRPGDLHFAELSEPYVRSGQFDEVLRGIPVVQDDAEGGTVGMDDHALGVRVEALMREVATSLRELIDRLDPGASQGRQADAEVTLAALRQQVDGLLMRHLKRPATSVRIVELTRRLLEQEIALATLIDETLDSRSDSMAKTILDRAGSDRASGAAPRRTYVAMLGAAHLQRMAERLQESGRAYLLLCPHGASASIDACH